MKIKKVNKILAIIMLFLTLFSVIQPVFAASGSGKWSGGQYASGMKTTDNANGTTGVIIRRLNNLNTGEKKTVFCAEHGIDFKTGATYNGVYYTPTNSSIRKACKVAYLGWYKNNGEYTVDGGILASDMKWVKWDYVFTQQYIWEILGQSNATFIKADEQQGYVDFKNRIENEIASIERRPSFNGTTITIEAGETKTITDSNGVLAEYGTIDNTKDGIRFVHQNGSNSMAISVDENTNLENYRISDSTFREWGMIKNGTEDTDTMVYFEFAQGVQDQLYCMSYNDPVTLNFSLKIEALGKLELSKLNTNGDLVDGAVFNVKGVNNYDKDVVVTNGKIELEKLRKGNYYIKEKSSPDGYLLNTETYKVLIKPNETSRQAIVDDEPTGELTINKIDIDTGIKNRVDGTIHHGDASIEGSEYTLYAKSDIYNKKGTIKYFSKDDEIAKFTFDKAGNATIKITNSVTPAKISVKDDALTGLPMGEYYSKETIIPNGYTQDKNTYTYTFSYKDSSTKVIKTSGIVKNTIQKAPFEVIKVSTNNNTTAQVVEGAEFTAILTKYVDYYGSFDEALKHLDQYAEDEYSVFKTGKNGHGVSGLLAYGEYTINETYTPSSKIEKVEQFYVTIDRDSKTPIKELVENDLPFEAYIKLQKQDKETGKFVTYSNATFKLYKLNEKTNKWEKVECKVKDQYYDKWTTDKNGIAKTETKLGAGKYKVEELKVPTGFIQQDEELIFEVDNRNATLNYDKDMDAWITVTIKNSQPKAKINVTKKVNLKNDVDTTLIKNIDYSKISFELVAKENIIDYADGSIIYEKGKRIGTYNLNNDGTLTIDNLKMGKYYLKELSTIDGAVLDNTEYDVIFEQKDTKTKEYVIDIKIENETTTTEFSKTDVTGQKELPGAKLIVTDENNKIVDSWTSAENTHKIEGLVVGKTYTLTEEIAPNQYVKATSIKFTIENNKEIKKVNMKDKIVEVTKEDISGNEIEGAKLQVLDESGNVIDEWISGKESHKVTGLEENKTYKLHEELSVGDYVKASDIEFKVTSEKENQKIVMVDKLVEVTKTDITNGNELEGAELEVSDENGNIIDKWTSTKQAHKVKGLEEGKKYILKEVIAPYGFQVAEEIEFIVTDTKETQKIEMKDMPILKNVKVIKIDAETKEIIKDKFTFAIYEDNECTKLIKEIKSDKKDGIASFEELRYGTYFIKEVKAPKNYELSNKIVKLEINDKGTFIDGIQVEEKDNTIEFTFENKKIEVPKTGDESKIKLFAGAILLSLLGIIYIIIKSKKNNHK